MVITYLQSIVTAIHEYETTFSVAKSKPNPFTYISIFFAANLCNSTEFIIENATVYPDGSTDGSDGDMFNVTCDKYFHISGEASTVRYKTGTLTCLPNGSWNNSVSCEGKYLLHNLFMCKLHLSRYFLSLRTV